MKAVQTMITLSILPIISLGSCQQKQIEKKTNVIILFSDDAGFADFSMNGNKKISTPNIDQIAKNGVTFSNGYVSGPVCSPSRAGLLTGRYQQRFGHDCNIGDNYSKTDPELVGINTKEITIADLMKKYDYHTGMVGKWHLGSKDQFHPCNRGFDEFFGFLGGGNNYKAGTSSDILRNFEPVDNQNLPYLTDVFGDEGCQFIERNKDKPFFLYLSFNAPHTPMHARADYLEQEKKKFKTLQKAVNSAMTRSLDENIGKVMRKLMELNLDENTLVIFTNDNGGAMPYNASCNDPFSGTKGTFLEGGIHVPFIAQWPGVIPEGIVYEEPVITLDILPTALSLAGGDLPKDRKYDGVNLMPYILGEKKSAPHDALFWRLQYHGAIRKGDWKLIWFDDMSPKLYNLKNDIAERVDLSLKHPEKTTKLLKEFNNWQRELAKPTWVNNPCWREHSYDRYNQTLVEGFKRD